MKNRAEVAEKIDWEGGLVAALEYGLTENDMPEGDAELRATWTKLREGWEQLRPVVADIRKMLNIVT